MDLNSGGRTDSRRAASRYAPRKPAIWTVFSLVLPYTLLYCDIPMCTPKKRSQPLFTSSQDLSDLRCQRVSQARLNFSSRAALFLSAVSLTVRPPRRGLPRPNCHSQGLTSYTLLPRLPSAAAESAQPYGKPESFRTVALNRPSVETHQPFRFDRA